MEAGMIREQPIWFYSTVSQLPPDVFEEWEERASIIQYDAGYDKGHAECLALILVIRKYSLTFETASNQSSYMNTTNKGETTYE